MCMCVFVCIFLSFVRGCTCWYEVKYINIIILVSTLMQFIILTRFYYFRIVWNYGDSTHHLITI